jgi:hypothetical protein
VRILSEELRRPRQRHSGLQPLANGNSYPACLRYSAADTTPVARGAPHPDGTRAAALEIAAALTEGICQTVEHVPREQSGVVMANMVLVLMIASREPLLESPESAGCLQTRRR